MNKITHALTIAAVVLLLAGCASAPEMKSLVEPESAPETIEVQTAEEIAAAELAETIDAAPTAPGEICDIDSMYTVECHKEFPEVAYLNGLTRNAGEPLASMSDAEKVELGQEACAQLRAGTAQDAVNVVEGASSLSDNNTVVVSLAIPSFCTEFSTSGLFD